MAEKKTREGDAPSTNVALQATFDIPHTGSSITINTADIATGMPKKGEIKFNLDEPKDIGSISNGLRGVYQIFNLGTPPDVKKWPLPFNDLATADLTVTAMCVDQAAGTWAFGMDISFKDKPKIPIVEIPIAKIGFKINQGQCPAKEDSGKPAEISSDKTKKDA